MGVAFNRLSNGLGCRVPKLIVHGTHLFDIYALESDSFANGNSADIAQAAIINRKGLQPGHLDEVQHEGHIARLELVVVEDQGVQAFIIRQVLHQMEPAHFLELGLGEVQLQELAFASIFPTPTIVRNPFKEILREAAHAIVAKWILGEV